MVYARLGLRSGGLARAGYHLCYRLRRRSCGLAVLRTLFGDTRWWWLALANTFALYLFMPPPDFNAEQAQVGPWGWRV